MTTLQNHLRECCGIFGIYGNEQAAEKTYLGLYALQHRGQESAGIAASNGRVITLHRETGLVWAVFAAPGAMDRLKGHAAIGHTRYSTTGATGLENAQPLLMRCKGQQIAAAHNGNLVNSQVLRQNLEDSGSILQTTSDSEIVLHLIAKSKKPTLEESLLEALVQLNGAYCFLFLTPAMMVAARDPFGFRPLCLGQLGSATLVASESCAFDISGAQYLRSLEAGEVLIIDEKGLTSHHLPPVNAKAFCIFEYIYFSRPDSYIFGEQVDKIRRRLGEKLVAELPCEADFVIPVPDSANTGALGYAHAAGMPFEIGLIRNHYVGRTFIAPHQEQRDLDVKVKFNPVRGLLRGKRIVLVEDSIVRGTTLRQLVGLLRHAGAAEVHVRVSSPPIRFPCFYGIDISGRGELIAATHTLEEIRQYIEADSLAYLSVRGLLAAVATKGDYCTACFTGNYPTEVPQDFCKEQFDLKYERS